MRMRSGVRQWRGLLADEGRREQGRGGCGPAGSSLPPGGKRCKG